MEVGTGLAKDLNETRYDLGKKMKECNELRAIVGKLEEELEALREVPLVTDRKIKGLESHVASYGKGLSFIGRRL